jgi:hypothetical protein
MASQFIQQGNQNLLWKIINNTPQMISFFAGAAPGDKERWFQQIIGHVYEDNVRKSTNLGLREINKGAIDLMVELLKKAQAQQQQQAHQTQSQQHQQQQPDPIENMQNTQIINKPGVSNVSSMENQFELRRKEYEIMTKKTVPTPTFKENVKDEAIGDIGSAVNEYMKQRDLDSKMFAPKEPLTPVVTQTSDITLNVEEIDDHFSAKKVKWGENTEHVYKENGENTNNQIIMTSIAQILEMLETLTKKVDAQGELINSLMEKK